MRRLALVVVAVLALAACGGSSKPKTPSAESQIKSAYAKFFSPKTSLSDRVGLLQNGPRFKSLIRTFAANPLAQNVSASVSSVTLEGANKAKVAYVVKFGGTSLPEQNGSAVRENGTWKLGSASLCKLVALQGSTPSACKS